MNKLLYSKHVHGILELKFLKFLYSENDRPEVSINVRLK